MISPQHSYHELVYIIKTNFMPCLMFHTHWSHTTYASSHFFPLASARRVVAAVALHAMWFMI